MNSDTRTRPAAVLWGLTIAGLLAGIAGLVMLATGGHTSVAYGTYVPWGLWVAIYATLIGISVGAFIVVSLVYGFQVRALAPLGRTALYVASGAFAGGLLAVWLDLGHPWRFLELFFNTDFGSVMGILAWLYALYGVLLIALIVLIERSPDAPAIRRLAIGGLFFVVIFGGAEGSLFGVVQAQALWESGLTPILFLAEGAMTGIALVVAIAALFGKIGEAAARFSRWLLFWLILAVVVLEWAEMSTAFYAGIPSKTEALKAIMFGEFWWVFWLVHVLAGLAVPLVLLTGWGKKPWALVTAGSLVAITAFAMKLNFVVPALTVPEFEGLRLAFTGPGLSFTYFPTLTEWLLGVGAVAFGGLVFLLLDQFIPEAEAKTLETVSR